MVEESIHVKFNGKEPDYNMSKPVEGFADIQVFEEHPEAGTSNIRSSEDDGSDAGLPEDDLILEAHTEAENSERTSLV